MVFTVSSPLTDPAIVAKRQELPIFFERQRLIDMVAQNPGRFYYTFCLFNISLCMVISDKYNDIFSNLTINKSIYARTIVKV